MTKSISFIIKALNEEDNIAKCIESCLREAEGYESEIILVDSLSTDRTVEIAKEYPITILQFLNRCDASCGSAPQLGYQYSTGAYIFLIDGDMELAEGFMAQAFSELDNSLDLAGISGVILDTQEKTSADTRRKQEYAKISKPVEVSSLGGGGLYRRAAIETVGYFSNQSLKACEELELGVRLIANGYRLLRLPTPSVIHTGHSETELQSLIRLWHAGRIGAYSVFLKSSIGSSWFFLACKKCWFLFIAPFSIFLTFVVSVICQNVLLGGGAFFLFWIGCLLYLTIKRGSLYTAIYSIISWCLFSIASVNGFSQRIIDPLTKISSCKIK
jgi:glycosyltransferase involved in cell wall biosynthesis